MCPTAPNHLSKHQCTRRIVLQYAPAKGCSTGGHFLPLRNQRHNEVCRPLDSVSTGSVEYAGTLLHSCQLEDPRAEQPQHPVRHSPAPVQVHYNKVQPSHLWRTVLLSNGGFYQSKGRINSINSCAGEPQALQEGRVIGDSRRSSLRRMRNTGSSCSSSPLKLAPYFK